MKHGANNLSLIEGNMPNKDQKIINKCLDVLLQEVNAGDFEDFRYFIIQKNTRVIDLKMGKAENIDLKHLGEALNGTKVKVLNLHRNKIGADGVARLAACIPGTLLLKVHLGEKYLVLTKALEKNAQKIMVTPYYLAHLAHHLEMKQSEMPPTNELDIFMSAGKDMQGHILSFFPLMTSKMVYKYQEIPAETQESAFSFCTIS